MRPARSPARGGGHDSEIQVVFSWVYASSACSERSRPWPESFMPPNGVASDDGVERVDPDGAGPQAPGESVGGRACLEVQTAAARP